MPSLSRHLDSQEVRERLPNDSAATGQGMRRRVTINGFQDAGLFAREHRSNGHSVLMVC
jgi:hypothetical protein